MTQINLPKQSLLFCLSTLTTSQRRRLWRRLYQQVCHGVWSLIRRMQRPNRMADFFNKTNRFAQNESANRESECSTVQLLQSRQCFIQ